MAFLSPSMGSIGWFGEQVLLKLGGFFMQLNATNSISVLLQRQSLDPEEAAVDYFAQVMNPSNYTLCISSIPLQNKSSCMNKI